MRKAVSAACLCMLPSIAFSQDKMKHINDELRQHKEWSKQNQKALLNTPTPKLVNSADIVGLAKVKGYNIAPTVTITTLNKADYDYTNGIFLLHNPSVTKVQ